MRQPTLQSLALKARDFFGEDGYPFEESIPSSLDIVVAAYADDGRTDDVTAYAGMRLRWHLERRGYVFTQVNVDDFVQSAIVYLQVLYPRPQVVRDIEERRALSHLFWGHLVAARNAMTTLAVTQARPLHSSAAPTVQHTLTCSCGAELTSADEEELYRFARAHAAQQHRAPRQPLRPTATRAFSGVGS